MERLGTQRSLVCVESVGVRVKLTLAVGAEASFRESNHAVTAPHPSIEVKGITTIRLQRLHLSSNPCPRTFAMS
jgi:hypothetical protein